MSWIENISSSIETAFSTVRPPLPALPALLLLCEVANRPGISAIAMATAIIRRLAEAGIETGVNPDGSPNKICQFIRIFCEEICRELKDNAKITSALQSSALVSVGTGANAGGTVTVASSNIMSVIINGLMQ